MQFLTRHQIQSVQDAIEQTLVDTGYYPIIEILPHAMRKICRVEYNFIALRIEVTVQLPDQMTDEGTALLSFSNICEPGDEDGKTALIQLLKLAL